MLHTLCRDHDGSATKMCSVAGFTALISSVRVGNEAEGVRMKPFLSEEGGYLCSPRSCSIPVESGS